MGGRRLRDYRVYYLDATGRVFRREAIRCANDQLALARLDVMRVHGAVELWELGRLVKRLDKAS